MVPLQTPIDWQELLKLTNNKADLAQELLDMFAAELPVMSKAINQAFASSDFTQMRTLIHKLHGSCCYTGVSRLKFLTQHMEELLKLKNHAPLASTLKQLNQEMTHVLTAIQQKSYLMHD